MNNCRCHQVRGCAIKHFYIIIILGNDRSIKNFANIFAEWGVLSFQVELLREYRLGLPARTFTPVFLMDVQLSFFSLPVFRSHLCL